MQAVIAFCARGRRLITELTLLAEGEVVSEVRESAALTGPEVLLVDPDFEVPAIPFEVYRDREYFGDRLSMMRDWQWSMTIAPTLGPLCLISGV